MKTVQASKFKAACLKLMRTVEASGEPLLVTHRNRPFVRIEPWVEKRKPKLGALKGQVKINGDIVHASFAEEWE